MVCYESKLRICYCHFFGSFFFATDNCNFFVKSLGWCLIVSSSILNLLSLIFVGHPFKGDVQTLRLAFTHSSLGLLGVKEWEDPQQHSSSFADFLD